MVCRIRRNDYRWVSGSSSEFSEAPKGWRGQCCHPWAQGAWRLREKRTWRSPMQGRRDNATVTHLNLQPRTEQKASHGSKFWYLTHRPHTRISPNPFGTNSGNASELRYSSGGRGGTQNDWEKQKCLRLIVYQEFEGRLDTDIRLHCGRFKKISYTTELVA